MSRYIPPLSVLISVENFPNTLGFLENGLNSVFSNLYFKDFYSIKSILNQEIQYGITIISKTRLGFNITGEDGFSLTLNPNYIDGDTSEFPLFLSYQWPLKKYVNEFDTSSFDFSISSIYHLLLKVSSLSEVEFFKNFIETFYINFGTVDDDDFYERFISDFNFNNNPPIPLTYNNLNRASTIEEDILTQLSSNGNEYNIINIILSDYLTIDDDFGTVKEKVERLFFPILGSLDLNNFQNFLVPKISGSLNNLILALEFPRTWLKPVDPVTLELIGGDVKSSLSYSVGSIVFDTQTGFDFINPDSFSLTPSQIGNTGLLIEIQNLKFDLRGDRNIPEADADGRGVDFKGVYIEYAGITLPSKWFNDDEVVGGVTAKIAGYNLLIGTGGISGTIALETQTFRNSDGSILNYYTDYFAFEYPIQTTHKNNENEIIITTIVGHSELKTQLETHEATQFVFPLSLTPVDGTTIEYNNPVEYYTYLNTLYNESDEANRPRLSKRIGQNGFEISFTSFDITFKQNKIVDSNILGGLKIPKLKDGEGNDAEIEITGHLDSDGDFLITASEQDGFAPIEIPEVLKLHIQSIELGQEDGDFFIGTTAELEFIHPVMNKLLCLDGENTSKRIPLPAVRIYSNGNFEIVGGSIPLPTNFGLCLGPVNMSVTNLNFTARQQEYQGVLREYKCWGFDGALNLDPLGVDVRGDGVKYYYTVDDDPANGKPSHSFIRISTIEVDIIIPGDATPSTATAIIKGFVSIPEPGVSTEYAGGVSLKLPKLDIAGSVAMRLEPKYPAFVLDANLELPTPIPLAATGLGVFGFRGLLGYRYVAEKEAVGLTSGEDSWYDYYTAPQRGVNIQKFRGPDETTDYNNPISLGAGAAIATYGNDRIINFRVFVLLSIPNLFFIEGTANILAPQLALDDPDEPPFFAFLAIGDDAIEAGLGADFRLPKNNGDILSLNAKVEAAFFFNNPAAFYVNIGTRQEPVSARLLSLLTAQTYLQLSAKGIEAGARAEFEFDKRYGPVRVRAYAYVEVGGKISFERPQIGGYLAIGGQAEVDIKILSLSIGLDLILAAEAAKPYLIYAEFRLCVKVKVFLVKIKFCGNVELKWEKSRQVDRTPIPPVTEAKMLELVKGVHMLTGDAFNLTQLNNNITSANYTPSANNNRFNNTVIPMDTYIDIKFEKPLNPNPVASKTGGVNNAPVNDVDLIPPQKIIRGKEVRQVKHAYAIMDIELKAWNGSNWVDYNPYDALFSGAVESGVTTDNLKIGHWQKTGKEYNALRILGDSPFSFTQLGEPGWYVPERIGVTAGSLFCTTSPLEPECANWLNKDTGIQYLANTDVPDDEDGTIENVENFFETGRMAFRVSGPTFLDNLDSLDYVATVTTDNNNFGFNKSLKISNFMSVEIRLPNPSNLVRLKLGTTGAGVAISYFKSVINDTALQPEYALVQETYSTKAELESEVIFENADEPITRIIVQPDFLNVARVNELLARLQILQQNAFETFAESAIGETEFIGTSDANEEVEIQEEIISLIESGCATTINGDNLTGGIGQMKVGTSFQVGARSVVLEGANNLSGCTTLIQEVCWLSEKDYEFNLKIPSQDAIQEDFELAEQSVSKVIAPIWRPDTKYYMYLKLRDEVDNDQSGTSQDYHYYYGFRTAGPIGHFHNASGVSYGLDASTGDSNRDGAGNLIAPDRFPLTNLATYIDYERSYPNADGNLLSSKPLFYANEQAKLQLYFVKPQTYHMFNKWEAKNGFSEIVSEMKVVIKDPASDILIPYPLPADFDEASIPNTNEEWEDDVEPLVPENVRFWNNLVEASGGSCVVRTGDAIRPKTKIRTMNLTNLKPQKLYTALVNNVHQGAVTEVHNYVFQTSRYANFSEQVNSYQLVDEAGNAKTAIFKVPVALSVASIDTMFNIIDSDLNQNSPDNTNLELATRFADRFDRIVEGIWGLAPLPVAETTEFNAVVDQNTGDTIALWIRNPEPFNDPKVPEAAIKNSIHVLNNANNDPDGNYRVLHNKDYAQVLIMRNSKKITNNALRVQFEYLLWNGSTYEIEDTVLVDNLNINS